MKINIFNQYINSSAQNLKYNLIYTDQQFLEKSKLWYNIRI